MATIDPVAFERTIEVNLIGVWRTVRAALPHVVARQGYILTIASLAAALHPPMLAHYAATKAGVEAFSDSLRAEVAHTGTRVGVAYFSFIDTDMTRDGLDSPAAQPDARRDAGAVQQDRAVVGRGQGDRARRIPSRRQGLGAALGAADDVAARHHPAAPQRGNRDKVAEAVRLAEADAAQGSHAAAERATPR